MVPAVALVTALHTSAAQAQATLIRGLGGEADFGSNYLPYNDDGFSSIIDITPAFSGGLRFFRTTPWRYIFVNNNGNINFVAPGTTEGCYTFTPTSFPLPMGTCGDWPIIAPWWADVDTRGGGRPTHNGVYYDLRPGQLTVTWYQVGVYSQIDTVRNTFQLILRSSTECGDGDFDVEFRYNRCEWYAGEASGSNSLGTCDPGMSVEEGGDCTPAQVGFDSGDGSHFYTLTGSRTRNVRSICTGSNVGMPGVYRFQIRGGELPCMGSGSPCTVSGAVGLCAAGHIQCRGGMPTCISDSGMGPERCDGADNDCNGMIDDGNNLCTPGYVCDRGNCVPQCVEGSCFDGQTCTMRNTCVDTDCLTVTCTQGEVCSHGHCIDACNNVRCPPPTTCRLGRCIDACAGITCDPGNVCENGLCVLACRCRPCASGEVCGHAGTCVPAECIDVTCPDGQFCRAGMCINACDVAMCPEGDVCDPSIGRCVSGISRPDAGTTGGDGGSSSGDGGGTTTGDGGRVGDGGTMAGDAGRADASTCFGSACGGVRSACGCSTPGQPSGVPTRAVLALGALCAAVLSTRRRRA